MLKFNRFGAATFAVSMLPMPALADVSALDVWNSWQAMAGEMGQSLTSEGQSQTGDRLTVSGIAISMDLPDGAVFALVGDVVFVENGDGTVGIEFPASYPMRVTGRGAADEDFDMTLQISQPNLSLIASGDPQTPSYAYRAPEIAITSDELTIGDDRIEFDLNVSLRSLDGVYDFLGLSEAESRLSIGAMAMRLLMTDFEGPDTNFAVNMTVQDIATLSSGAVSPLNAAQSLGAMLGQGFASTGETTYGPVTYGFSGGDGTEQFEVGGSIESGTLSAQMGEGALSYGGENVGSEITVSGTQIPFPNLTFAMERSSGTVTLPLAPSDEAEDFVLSTRLSGVTIDDRLWSMFDPGGTLPRDGANLTIDLAGKGRWFVDITDPEIAETMGMSGEMPGEIESLDIRELRLSAVGTELSGSGGFTFSEGSFGVPQPDGAVDLRLTGSNALLDSLVAMGLLPEEQAMGARMMLGLFARPGTGPDALETTIEVRPDGSVLANGQRIR